MRKIKNLKYSITPSLAGMAGWLFIVTVVMGIFFAYPKEKQEHTPNLTDEILSGAVIVTPSQAAVRAEVALIRKPHSAGCGSCI